MSTETADGQVPWWKEPTKDQWMAWLAGWLGWTLDAFDFTIFLLILVPVSQAFHVPLAAVALVVTLTLWMRLFGAVGAGWLADRVGRKTPLMISIAWFSVCNFIAGFSPTFGFLALFRALLGLGMGGEWPAGAALAMEAWPARSRGLMSGVLQGSWNLGFLAASLVYGALFEHIGWRGMLWVGIVPALAIVYVRFFVKESAVWQENRRLQRAQGREVRMPLARIFRKRALGNTLNASWWMISSFVVYYSINTLFATHLEKDLGMRPAEIALPIALTSVAGFIASVFWGWAADTIGRRWAMIIPGVLAMAVAPLYLLTDNLGVIAAGFLLQGFFGQALYALNPSYLAERFPTEVRAVGSAFCYHIGAIAGGAVAPVLTVLAVNGHWGFGRAMLAGTVVGCVSFVIALWLGPETKGKALVADLDPLEATP